MCVHPYFPFLCLILHRVLETRLCPNTIFHNIFGQTSPLLNGWSNQLSYESMYHESNSKALMEIDIVIVSYWRLLHKWDLLMLWLRVGPKTSHLLNGCSNQLSYESRFLHKEDLVMRGNSNSWAWNELVQIIWILRRNFYRKKNHQSIEAFGVN